MTTPVFPASLPGVSLVNFGYQPGSNVLRADMETGPAKVRRRFMSVPTNVAATWTFTQLELAVFEQFCREQLFDGVAWFQVPITNGVGETMCTARFHEPYRAETLGREDAWRVTAQLEVMNMPTIQG